MQSSAVRADSGCSAVSVGVYVNAPGEQVMELAQGGSLLDYVRQRKRLAEPEACFFLQQIVHGLMHCHDLEV